MPDAGTTTSGSSPVDSVCVFRVDLQAPADLVAGYRSLLTDSERARADRFVTAELTRRSIVCRGVLRLILGRRIHRPPGDVPLLTGPHGKPSLALDGAPRVEFNVSHTGELALIAVAAGRELGVDVESHDRGVSRDELAARFFSERERQAYFALPAERRIESFFRIWTCKEAYMKAIGSGLSLPLGSFSVSAHPDEPPGLLHVDDQPQEVARWSYVLPAVGPSYSAALAVEGHGWTLRVETWDHRTGIGAK